MGFGATSSEGRALSSNVELRARVAIVGVGNCASSLVQGIEFYRNAGNSDGLITPVIGSLKASDIEVCAAFDVDNRKVGKRLSTAIHAPPNNTINLWDGPLTNDPIVEMGVVLDGVASHMTAGEDCRFEVSDKPPIDVVSRLKDSGARIVICYLPVGSEEAVRWYARAALEAGCGFINCVPVYIANDPEFAAAFAAEGLPLIGDDIRSQVGATIVHQRLTELLIERGYLIQSTYQLNFGGNTDFRNMLDLSRLETKKRSKTSAVTAKLEGQEQATKIHVGPSDFVPHLFDQKLAFIELKGTGFGGAPITLEVKLSVCDSPNSAGVAIDLVRYAALAIESSEGGVLHDLSSYYMKSPPARESDSQSRLTLRARATDKHD